MSSSDMSMQQVSIAELHSEMVAMERTFTEYMQLMCDSQVKIVEHLEKVRWQPRALSAWQCGAKLRTMSSCANYTITGIPGFQCMAACTGLGRWST